MIAKSVLFIAAASVASSPFAFAAASAQDYDQSYPPPQQGAPPPGYGQAPQGYGQPAQGYYGQPPQGYGEDVAGLRARRGRRTAAAGLRLLDRNMADSRAAIRLKATQRRRKVIRLNRATRSQQRLSRLSRATRRSKAMRRNSRATPPRHRLRQAMTARSRPRLLPAIGRIRAAPQQAGQDQRYAAYAEQWAQTNCVRSGSNAGAGAVIGGLLGALVGSGVARSRQPHRRRGRRRRTRCGRRRRGGRQQRRAPRAQAVRPASSPAVVRRASPMAAMPEQPYVYAAPGWYRPWVLSPAVRWSVPALSVPCLVPTRHYYPGAALITGRIAVIDPIAAGDPCKARPSHRGRAGLCCWVPGSPGYGDKVHCVRRSGPGGSTRRLHHNLRDSGGSDGAEPGSTCGRAFCFCPG